MESSPKIELQECGREGPLQPVVCEPMRTNPMSMEPVHKDFYNVLNAPAQINIDPFDKIGEVQDRCFFDTNNCYIDEKGFIHGCYVPDGVDSDRKWRDGCHCADEPMKRDDTDVPVEEIRPCCGACCCIGSLFCGFPSCIGCTYQYTLCCCMSKYACCKCLDCSDEHKKCFNCCVGSCYCVKPNKILEGVGQVCCVDARCAFPCTNKVPCICMVLPACTFCADFRVKIACNQKMGEIMPRLKERASASGAAV